ncbi:CIA30 family protein [Aliterella atlantica]|uniref:NADH:ubiquinone oxidoreductase n=1 Tax=Aliterella atlantica CENA595 TaxID=1618023 RepID=A0A0D8ZXU5_9CYAN|nr:CIA30 family protein [Aliterella atlantica]KJH73254.1 NADH:ubiquinone oxidoreductase [Aliterella atlantica CENA595]
MTQQNRSRWDAGRFIQTLAYFDIIPFFSWLQKLIPGNAKDNESSLSRGKSVGVVLVAGATGGVGKRVVQRLLERGYKVRSLVRDKDKAQAILGNNTELFVGDITKQATLTPELMANVQAVICCTAVRVQPKEGDTPDRAKYNQGIKFYEPEVVGDTPENVEYNGVKNLVQAAVNYLQPVTEQLLFDFWQPSNDLKNTWGAVDDVVMGGVSESEIRLIDGAALFTGNVSTQNSGGFVSVRTKNLTPLLDLSKYEGVELRVKGDGNRYKFLLRTESKWDGVAYSYSFDTISNTWISVRIPFSQMVPVFRAKTLKTGEEIDSKNICSLQLMLSKFEYDGELNPNFTPGGFALQVESIKACGGEILPQFVLVSSAGVTRPNRPGINLEEEPPAVRMNERLGGILTWKLRGEDSLRASGKPYTIIRPCALTEEIGVQQLIFEQGDNIRGKVSRDSIAELCIQALAQPKACNVTFEVKAEESSNIDNNWENLFASLHPDK